jgi:uncharacterized delta-60 repeat protein
MAKVPTTGPISITNIRQSRNIDGTAGTTSNTFSVLRNGANFSKFDPAYLQGATQLSEVNAFSQWRNYPFFFGYGGFNDTVRALLPDQVVIFGEIPEPNNAFLVGGDFTEYVNSGATFPANKFTRIMESRITDSDLVNFNAIGGGVFTIARQSDSKILVGGSFFEDFVSLNTRYIKRLNSNGSFDGTFSISSGFDNFVQSIVVQGDQKVIAGGDFNTYQNVSANKIIRLNSNGSRDTTYSIGTGFAPSNSAVFGLDLQSDGKVVAVGSFTLYQGSQRNFICRINTNGSNDTTLAIGSGFNDTVIAVKIQADQKILVGGTFTIYTPPSQSFGRNRFIRLNSNASVDTSFDIGTGFNNTVTCISLQDDGKILVGGAFTTYRGISANRIIRLNSNGTRDTSFDIGVGFNGSVGDVTVLPDNKIVVGGAFTTYKNNIHLRLVILNVNGSVNEDAPPEPLPGTGVNISWSLTANSFGEGILFVNYINQNSQGDSLIESVSSGEFKSNIITALSGQLVEIQVTNNSFNLDSTTLTVSENGVIIRNVVGDFDVFTTFTPIEGNSYNINAAVNGTDPFNGGPEDTEFL